MSKFRIVCDLRKGSNCFEVVCDGHAIVVAVGTENGLGDVAVGEFGAGAGVGLGYDDDYGHDDCGDAGCGFGQTFVL